MRGYVKMKMLRALLVAGASLAVANSVAADVFGGDFSPYVGIDFKERWMANRPTFASAGKKSNALPGGTIYVGSRWDCFGLELGLEGAGKKKQTISFGQGSTAKVKGSLWGGYLDALAYLPVADCTDVFAGFGLGVMNHKTTYNNATGDARNYNVRGRTSVIGRVRLGANYMVSECVGLRAVLGWESTQNLAHHLKYNGGSYGRISNAGNSFTAQVGVFTKF